jgi:hypothetical protein
LLFLKLGAGHLSDDASAARVACGDFFRSALALHVHHIKRRANDFGYSNSAAGGFDFENVGARKSVALGPVDALSENHFLAERHHVAVFSVDHRQRAQFLAAVHATRKLLVVDHQRSFVRHEKLERIDSVFDRELHFSFDIAVPLRDSHVKAIVHARFLRLLAVDLVSLFNAAVERQGKVDVHGCAPGKRSSLATEKIIARLLPHKRHLQMSVRLDAAGHDIPAGARYNSSCGNSVHEDVLSTRIDVDGVWGGEQVGADSNNNTIF